MPLLKQIAHLCIHSADLNSNQRFYCECLGMKRRFEFEKEGKLYGYYLEVGKETFVEVFSGEAGPIGNINHLAIEVEDIDAVLERLDKFGYEHTAKELGGDHSWQAWVTDPDGIRIEFHEYTEKSMQLKGGTCPVTW